MKQFNFLTSNPAFNIASPGNKAGTGGNSTLYKTSTKYSFDKYLLPNGILLNITLKGIIPDLVNKYYQPWTVHNINLMDDINVWDYNTCYFFIEKSGRTFQPVISGGLASKIYSPFEHECFPFTYYSGADKGMSGFDKSFTNKVIRKLPGRDNNNVIYDYTNVQVPSGSKFAFNVMESKKSYTITDEPIRGGTICYVSTKDIQSAEKLKLFVENNEIFKKYVSRTNQKYHAFALRNIKKFDLKQIITGHEIPKEWNITTTDLQEPAELYNEVIEDRTKVKEQGEVFTPLLLVEKAFNDLIKINKDAFSNPTYTFCDTMCGTGKFLETILKKKIENGIDKKTALETIYGIELDANSVNECRAILSDNDPELLPIVERNIVHSDLFEYSGRFDSKNPYKTEEELQFDTLFE